MATSQHASLQTTTQSQLISYSNTWTIENFSFTKGTIQLPPFVDSQANRFTISLELQDYDDEPYATFDMDEFEFDDDFGYVSVTINATIAPYVNLYILGANGEKHFNVEKNDNAFIPKYTGAQNYKLYLLEYIPRKELIDPSKGYLPNDKLTLVCEIRYTADRKTIINGDLGASIETVTQLKALEDMNELFTTGMHADVTFLLGEQQLPAHKAILSARSSVFAAMFTHKDTKEMLENKVEIKDVDVDAFKAMLTFLYTGKVPSLEQKVAENLLAAADKYQLEQLKSICENYLCDQLTIESAPNLLIFADAVNSAKLKEKCVDFISSRSVEMIKALKSEPHQLVDMFRMMAQKNETKNAGDE